ncbi:hypothetical protein M0802_008996 [Mischocyttarus mexicanus]|nr:hypothetical protein M0802_008996 [Mischocyttarus mexicanus]
MRWSIPKPIYYASVITTTVGASYLIKDYLGGSKYEGKEDLKDKVVIVTGASSGIGKETAREFAARNAKVILACRNKENCEQARKDIVIETKNKHVYCRKCDLASQENIRHFVNRFKKENSQLHILVNNAGVMRCPKSYTKEGIETQLGVNHMGHFLLTNLLLDVLKESAPSRIINVSSNAHLNAKLKVKDLNSMEKYDPHEAYRQSKLANILFTKELAKKLEGTEVTVNAVHPGTVDTEITRHMTMSKNLFLRYFFKPFMWPFIKSPKQGAQTVLYVALDPKLKSINGAYFRHGDRTPIEFYPNDPFQNESLWPVPCGQLTNLGKNQHLHLGQWLKNRYSHLLTNKYVPCDIYIRSTDVDRTLMSAEANLAGLYPPKGDQIWSTIRWMPIPVHTTPELEDNLLAGKKYCPKYLLERDKVLQSPEIIKINKENKYLYDYLTEKTGRIINTLKDAEYLYDTLYIEYLYNKTLPEWTKTVFPDKLKPLAEKCFTINAYNKILQRLKTGLLLGEMIDHMEKKSKNALIPDRKVWVYSAHDETIANMLMTLNLFDPHCPPYTATILIELRISYKNTTKEPNLLTFSGCDTLCPLDKFIELTKDVIPEDWHKECLIKHEKSVYNIDATVVVAILASSILMLVSLTLSVIGVVYWHYKRTHNQYYLRLTTDPI